LPRLTLGASNGLEEAVYVGPGRKFVKENPKVENKVVTQEIVVLEYTVKLVQAGAGNISKVSQNSQVVLLVVSSTKTGKVRLEKRKLPAQTSNCVSKIQEVVFTTRAVTCCVSLKVEE
jgi:hypothetical protein